MPMNHADAGLLRPRTSIARDVSELNGLWRIALERDGDDWRLGVPGDRLIAVPGAWNEQLVGGLVDIQAAWYERSLEVSECLPGKRRLLRFDAAALACTVWLDGELVGSHEGGFLPFAFDVTDRLEPGREHRLTVRVEHGLSTRRTPVGGKPGGVFQSNPPTSYDFFPYGGLIRPVRLLTVPDCALRRIETDLLSVSGAAELRVRISAAPCFSGTARIRVRGRDGAEWTAPIDNGEAQQVIGWNEVRMWQPTDPHLEQIEVALMDGQRILDQYVLPVGVRTIAVEGDRLLLNGEPIVLKGFGKHEDFPVFGRGLAEPVAVRDAELLDWIGANSYRTSHYPYAEEALDIADRRGILVISEPSAVGVNFYDDVDGHEDRLAYVRTELAALIARDREHPSVIAWSVANEPFAKPIFQPGSPAPDALERGINFLSTLVEDAHRLDASRPAMVVGAQGHPDAFIGLGDIVAINRYYGWYSQTGDAALGGEVFAAELDALHARFGKPILVSEFGADTLPGCHSAEAELWSEEFQAEMVGTYLDAIETRPFVVGAHVWNFADFKTTQSILRAGGLNHKGVFTRDRRPKLVAHLLRQRWTAPG